MITYFIIKIKSGNLYFDWTLLIHFNYWPWKGHTFVEKKIQRTPDLKEVAHDYVFHYQIKSGNLYFDWTLLIHFNYWPWKGHTFVEKKRNQTNPDLVEVAHDCAMHCQIINLSGRTFCEYEIRIRTQNNLIPKKIKCQSWR